MSTVDELEKQIHKNALAINEMGIRIDTINRHADELFKELNVSSDQISAFIENKDHFTDENWQALNQKRHALDEKLQRELANVRDPRKVKKAQAERYVPPHWLFVR